MTLETVKAVIKVTQWVW